MNVTVAPCTLTAGTCTLTQTHAHTGLEYSSVPSLHNSMLTVCCSLTVTDNRQIVPLLKDGYTSKCIKTQALV